MALATSQLKDKKERTDFARAELRATLATLPSRFQMCFDPRYTARTAWAARSHTKLTHQAHTRTHTHACMAAASHRLEVRTIAVDECRVMDSAQAPLWVEAVNHDPLGKVTLQPPRQRVAFTAVLLLWGVATGENIPVIFKAGDDLRQDLMTLELMRTMDDVSSTLARECVCVGAPLTRAAPPPHAPPPAPPRPPLHRCSCGNTMDWTCTCCPMAALVLGTRLA